ncbi:MAG: YdeI/OmpD-associated family protein [Sulfobacillus sp.]
MEEALNGIAIFLLESERDWAAWLSEHHREPDAVWLKIAKKDSGQVSVSYAEALDLALCYGWIDGQKQSYDRQYFLQKFSPRRPQSIWSKRNVEKIASLTAAGRMQPAGLAAVDAARQDGRWQRAYDSHRTSTVPPDFEAALDQHPAAREFFKTLNKTNVYAILWRIQTAKKPDTRRVRIASLIAMLVEGKTLHGQRPPH